MKGSQAGIVQISLDFRSLGSLSEEQIKVSTSDWLASHDVPDAKGMKLMGDIVAIVGLDNLVDLWETEPPEDCYQWTATRRDSEGKIYYQTKTGKRYRKVNEWLALEQANQVTLRAMPNQLSDDYAQKMGYLNQS